MSPATFDAIGAGTATGLKAVAGQPALTADGKPEVLYMGGQYGPSALAGLSWTQVAAAMHDPSSATARDIDGAANVITAAICGLTHGQPGGVCQSAGVKAAAG